MREPAIIKTFFRFQMKTSPFKFPLNLEVFILSNNSQTSTKHALIWRFIDTGNNHG